MKKGVTDEDALWMRTPGSDALLKKRELIRQRRENLSGDCILLVRWQRTYFLQRLLEEEDML
jgi:hypothetical protein